jgi:hypothetical protein
MKPFSRLIHEKPYSMTNKTTLNLFLLFAIVAAGILVFTACHKSSDSGTSQLQIRLTDGPGPYDAVYIDVEKVEVNVSSDSGTSSGWQTLPLLRPGIYNLLDFRNGLDTVLASVNLPAGTLSQLRLTLGSNNSVVINGQSYPLKTPSAQQSGLKFNIHAALTSGIVYRLWIDFNAGSSIVATGNGGFILKPVIRTFSEAIGGSIKGYVLPTAAKPEVWAIQGTDTLLALPDTTTGYYFFGGVNAGTWNLAFHPLDSMYRDTTITVNVSTGVVTNVDTLYLQK